MQRKQFLVKLSDEEQGNKFIKFLENEGFENVHNISFEGLKIKVLVVGDEKFFGTNVTCLAALANKNIKPITIEEFIVKYKSNLEITNSI